MKYSAKNSETNVSNTFANVNHNIMIQALKTKFNMDDQGLSQIMEVLYATENPIVGAAILLGVYETPEILCQDDIMHIEEVDKSHVKFESYDKFTDEVYYMYYPIKRKKAWFAKGAFMSEENIASRKTWADDAAAELNIDEKTLREHYELKVYESEVDLNDKNKMYDTCSLHRWNQMVASVQRISPETEAVEDIAL